MIYSLESAPGPESLINGKKCIYFGGTSYYSLQSHPIVIEAATDAIKQFGISVATTRSGYGNSQLFKKLEKNVSTFLDIDDAVYLPSGYLSSLAAIQTLHAKFDFGKVFIDSSSHFANWDAVKLLNIPVISYDHCNPEKLREKLLTNLKSYETPLIVTDGVFPLFGEIAPLSDIFSLAEEFNAQVVIDDSHGLGVIGKYGKGTLDYHNVYSDRFISCGTLSKAFGGFGGVIAGKKSFLDKVRDAGIYKGSTPPSIADVAASIAGINILTNTPDLFETLKKNALYLKTELKKIGINSPKNEFPITAWSLESEKEMEKIQHKLFEQNIAIQKIKYSGNGNKSVLRVVVFANHTKDQIDYLIERLEQVSST